MNETEGMPDDPHRPAENPFLEADFDDDGVLCLTVEVPSEGPRRCRVINPELVLGPDFARMGADPAELPFPPAWLGRKQPAREFRLGSAAR